ncbi:nuclear transport factor 2 family protein [Streptomyces sp. NPDC051572]|uniref:nuclear transport factor 2 family protein n=1 Tax=unclassified Streptomyces TaxID=2593676 RepID=UPI00344F5ACF
MDSNPTPGHRSADPAVIAAVGEVLVRYASGIDRRDWELFRTCFTEDCQVDYGKMPSGEVLQWTSAGDVTAWMEAAHRDMGQTLHRITNQHVEQDGDGVTAACYVDVLLTGPDGRLIMNGAGFYSDRLLETTDGWKITARRFTPVLMRPGQA